MANWFSQNWMLLLLIGVLAVFLVMSYLKQKKEMNTRNDLISSIKKGTKIVTTAGVYGVVETIEETTDGKVTTIRTGNAKNPTTMTIHINAIMGIDNKTLIKEEKEVVEEKVDEKVEEKVEDIKEDSSEKEIKSAPKKSTAKKSTTKKASK